MKVTNLSNKTLFIPDLKFVPQAQSEGRRGEDVYLSPAGSVYDLAKRTNNDFVYLPNTSQVLRSASEGTLRAWRDQGIVQLEDVFFLNNLSTQTLNHNFGFPQNLQALKFTGSVVTGTVTATGKSSTVHVTLGGPLTSATDWVAMLSFAPTGPTGYVTNKTATDFDIVLTEPYYSGVISYTILDGDWEDAIGSFDAAQNAAFTAAAFTNTSGVNLWFTVRLF
jgi:hypothetical protein